MVDEAGDPVQYTLFTFIAGHLFKLSPGWLCLSLSLINLPQYTMELNYIF